MRKHGGFTIIEMVVVLAILGALLSMAVPMAQLASQRQREAELRQALRSIRSAIDDYHDFANRGGVLERRAGDSSYPPDLEVLSKGVRDPRFPELRLRYFLRRIPRDPFAGADLAAAHSWGLRSYASPPDAPAPGDDVFDVYSLSPRQALDGSWYRDW